MRQFSVEEYKEWLADPCTARELPKTQEELENLFRLASYYEEIKRKKLAAQLVMTQGDACSQEKLMGILRGDYESAVISHSELQHGEVDCGTFSVEWQEGKILVLVPRQKDMVAEVFADCGAEDGTLVIGREASPTVEHLVFELEVEQPEELSIVLYTHTKEKETGQQYIYGH